MEERGELIHYHYLHAALSSMDPIYFKTNKMPHCLCVDLSNFMFLSKKKMKCFIILTCDDVNTDCILNGTYAYSFMKFKK